MPTIPDCRCGCHATPWREAGVYGVECLFCGAATDAHDSASLAATAWLDLQAQRAAGSVAAGQSMAGDPACMFLAEQ